MKTVKRVSIFLVLISILVFTLFKIFNWNTNTIALGILSFVKHIKGDSIDLTQLRNENSQTIEHDVWDTLLRKHVSDLGKVDYANFLHSKIDLQNYLDLLSDNPPAENWNKNEKLAYWINAYNAFTVQLILDNYPLESIKDISDGLPMIGSPWDIKFFKIGGIEFDLNTIEHEILRKQFSEPRIHFAINCASISCPRLRNEAYTATFLNSQLEDQTAYFLKNKNTINENETKLSKIFDWFESDFTDENTIPEFLSRYQPSFDIKNTIEYLDYNWALNE